MNNRNMSDCNKNGHKLIKTVEGGLCTKCFQEFGSVAQEKESKGQNDLLPKMQHPPPPPRIRH